MADSNTVQLSRTLLKDMQIWARSLGFQQLGVSDIDLSAAEDQLQQWLARGFHGVRWSLCNAMAVCEPIPKS